MFLTHYFRAFRATYHGVSYVYSSQVGAIQIPNNDYDFYPNLCMWGALSEKGRLNGAST